MSLYEALAYLAAGLAASLMVSAVTGVIALAYGWWLARRDALEVDAIVGDVPHVPRFGEEE